MPKQSFVVRISCESPAAEAPTTVSVRAFVGQHAWHSYKFSAPKRTTLMEWSREDSELLAQMLNENVNRGTTSPKSIRERTLLKEVGRSRFNQFFPVTWDHDGEHPVKEYMRSPLLQQVVVESTAGIRGLTLDMFHLGGKKIEDGSEPLEEFLGFLVPIVYHPIGDTCEGRCPQSESSVGVLGCSRILPTIGRGDATRELERLKSERRISEVVVHTPLKDRERRILAAADEHALFYLMEVENRGVWHFASHLECPGGVPMFELDNNANISADHFVDPACPPFIGQPLVFLNLCRSAAHKASLGRTLPDYLIEKGAFGVIAPNFLVDEQFASDFANCFYRELFGADLLTTVGRALVRARVAIWRSGFSAGLGYLLHGQEDFVALDAEAVEPVKDAA